MRSRLGFRGRVALGAIVHTALLAAVLALLSFSNAAQDPVFLAAALGGTLALSITLALLGAHLATRPVRALTAAASALSGGDLAARAPTTGGRDLGELGEALNRLARELSGSLADLRRERDLLASILESMREGVLVLGPEGRIALANAALRGMIVMGPDAVGKTAMEAIRNAALEDALNEASSLSGRAENDAVVREVTLGGVLARRLMVRVSRLASPRGERGLLAVFHDVTELRRLETVRTDFVANVSHELRTPVTAISTATETLLSGALASPEDAAEFVAVIDRHAKRLRHLVEDLLDLSKIESKNLRLKLVDLDVPAAMEHAAGLVSDQASRRNARIRVLRGATPLRARADRRALEQVLFNLLDNAVKYAGEGASVTLSAEASEGSVVIAVKDTGPGIPEAHLGRIFERFYRVDAGRSRDLGGTGLGLAIVKHLLESMGGRIDVTSHPGKGTEFRVILQRSEPVAATATPS
jgi:two-component system phosphate regulon sensor histidine kinase PhoR